jgi:hypothetical protein
MLYHWALGVCHRLDERSRMNREVHVRIREGLVGKFRRATRLFNKSKSEDE